MGHPAEIQFRALIEFWRTTTGTSRWISRGNTALVVDFVMQLGICDIWKIQNLQKGQQLSIAPMLHHQIAVHGMLFEMADNQSQSTTSHLRRSVVARAGSANDTLHNLFSCRESRDE